MSAPTPAPADHHSRSAKINYRVLARTVGRVSKKLWPLYAFLLAAKLFLNLTDDEPFHVLDDLLFALWPALLFAACFSLFFFLALVLGTKLKMKQAQANPGPGKPPRGPKDPS